MTKKGKRSKLERLKEAQIKLDSSLAPLRMVVSNLDALSNALITLGVAYTGHRAAKNLGGKFPETLSGSLSALIGLKLAQSQNLAGGAAGVAVLTSAGLLASFPFDPYRPVTPIPEDTPTVPPTLPSDHIPPGETGDDVIAPTIRTGETGLPFLTCPDGYVLMENFLGRIACIPEGKQFTYEGWGWRIAVSA